MRRKTEEGWGELGRARAGIGEGSLPFPREKEIDSVVTPSIVTNITYF